MRVLQAAVAGSMGGEERLWVPRDEARRIFTSPNNDKSGNITQPMCYNHSKDRLGFTVSKLALLTSALPWKHVCTESDSCWLTSVLTVTPPTWCRCYLHIMKRLLPLLFVSICIIHTKHSQVQHHIVAVS